jgi:pantetheine-phosphate adenylyltransferase
VEVKFIYLCASFNRFIVVPLVESNFKLIAMKRAIFPGTFDPFTIGHFSVVQRGLSFFDEIVIGIGVNQAKKTLFSVDKRLEMVQQAFVNEPRVKVASYDSLTVDFALSVQADYVLRGLRSVGDFEYERTVADANRTLTGIETVILFTESKYSYISSTVVRDLISYGKDISLFLPPHVIL